MKYARLGHNKRNKEGTQLRTPEYHTWNGMIQRCTNPNHKRYNAYGARGIKVCERWKVFANFYADMGDRPYAMTLDRIDVDGNYEPSNCRWADADTQIANRQKKAA